MFLAVLPAAAVAFSACAGFQGRLSSPSAGAPGIDELIENYENYNVYFAGRAIHMPTALVFDPKSDDLQLTFHKYWMTVETPGLMRQVVDWMSWDSRYPPVLYEIRGKDGGFYGYMYSNETGVPITSPEPGVLRLGSMHPTHWDALGNGDRFDRDPGGSDD
jgi:hypothetical protein